MCEENPVDVAEAFDSLSEQELSLCFRLLPKEQAAEVFVEMDSDKQKMLINGFNDSRLREIVSELYLDDAADLVEEMPAGVVSRILKNTDKETVYTCYVTENRRLLGTVSVRSLLLAKDDEILSDLMTEDPIFVSTLDDRSEAAEKISRYDLLALPVLDAESRIVGIITIDDAIDFIETKATEDIAQMAAILPSEKPYLKTGTIRLWMSRIPWLMLLMLSATVTSSIIASYEASLAACTILTAFIPMLMGTGGNAGSQASVTVIRGLSINEIRLADTLRVIWKEMRVSMLCGLTLVPIAFLKVMYVDGLFREDGGARISFVIAATLFFIVVLAKLVGCVLPLIVKAVKLDPAVVANPFITTVVDALALVVYFALASRLIPALA